MEPVAGGCLGNLRQKVAGVEIRVIPKRPAVARLSAENIGF
jgi:hypothetical protein